MLRIDKGDLVPPDTMRKLEALIESPKISERESTPTAQGDSPTVTKRKTSNKAHQPLLLMKPVPFDYIQNHKDHSTPQSMDSQLTPQAPFGGTTKKEPSPIREPGLQIGNGGKSPP